MRNWKVVVGLTLCCALCSAALADTKVAASEAKGLSNPLSDTYSQLEALRNLSAAERTSRTNPLSTSLSESGNDQSKPQRALQGSGPVNGDGARDGGTRGIVNNTCATAPTVACGSTTEITFATPYAEDDEKRPSCAGNFAYYNSVWVKFVATTTAIKADLCTPASAEIDAIALTIYRATDPNSPCATLVEIACKNCSLNCGDDDQSPEIRFGPLTVGQTYYMQMGVFGYGTSCAGGPCTDGNYYLRLECDPSFLPCQINTAGIQSEGEPSGCSEGARINEGCNEDPVAFSGIVCGEARTGTASWQCDGARDTDWYRLLVNDPGQSYPVTINMSVQAEFVPDMFIIKKGPTGNGCDDLDIVAANNPVGFQICGPNPTQTVSYQISGPGEYWLFVAPNFCFGDVDCGRDYVLTVTTSACFPAVGACCTGATCALVAREDCNPATSFYFGDGSACVANQCFVCPPSSTPESEAYTCPGNGHTDSLNGGCGFSDTSPPFLPTSGAIVLVNNTPTTPYCGVTGTHFNAAPPNNTENLRDNDWYHYRLPSGTTAGTWKRIVVNIQSEIRAQVLIVNPDQTSACLTFADRIVADEVVEPGVPAQVKACVVKRAGFRPDVWVVIRPFKRGAPYDLPCGARYWFTVTAQDCTTPGACCVITIPGASQGCSLKTAAQCQSAGGIFAGEGSSCSEICCPCPAGTTPENDPSTTCGLPDDAANGGCNEAALGYPFNLTALDQSGDSVCGTVVFDGSTRDLDWYKYNHTINGGTINFTVQADFVAVAWILKPGAGTPAQQCSGLTVLNSAVGVECEPLAISAAGQPSGTYWVLVAPTFDTPLACGAPYYAQVNSTSGGGGGTAGRCCVPTGDPNSLYSGCVQLTESACLAAGGTYTANEDCWPNACADCPLAACPQDAPNEGALDDCFDPNEAADVNGGCNEADPNAFTPFGASGTEWCGTTAMYGTSRDTDWYEYNHTGGDLIWFVASEFYGVVFVIGPIYNPADKCCAAYDSYAIEFPADCNYYGVYIGNAPAGQYQIIVVPIFEGPVLPCGARYQLQAASGVQGACCFQGQCFITYEDICVPGGGTWQGDGSDCDPNPCPPVGACCVGTTCTVTLQAACSGSWQGAGTDCDPNPCNAQPTGACCVGAVCSITTQAACSGTWKGAGTDCDPNPCICLGDANCSGAVDFFDIDPFVAKIGCPASGPACNQSCPWQNCDVDQDGDVDFFDIDPFVATIGNNCQ